MGMVAFLLESETAKFLEFTRKLAAGNDQVTALESAYRLKTEELAERCSRWLLARR